MKHVAFAQLIEKLEGTLPSDDVREIEVHISDCNECSVEYRRLAQFFAYSDAVEYTDVPQAVTARILNTYVPKRKAVPQAARRTGFIAQLLFDDWQMALNERRSFADTRQLLYKIGENDLDLRLEFREDKCRIAGQIFPDCQNGVAEIFSENISETAVLDDNCEFSFDFVPLGQYGLRLTLDGEIIEVENLPVCL